MKMMDVCRAQYIMDYFGIRKIPVATVAQLLDVEVGTAMYILRELGWEREVLDTRTKAGNRTTRTIYHRNGSHKDLNGLHSRIARRRCAKQLCTTEEELEE